MHTVCKGRNVGEKMDLIPLFAFAIVVVFPCIIMVFEFRENDPYPLYTAVFYFIFGLLFIGGIRNSDAVFFVLSALSGGAAIINFILRRKKTKR